MCALEEITNITVFWVKYHAPSQTVTRFFEILWCWQDLTDLTPWSRKAEHFLELSEYLNMHFSKKKQRNGWPSFLP